VKTYEAMLLLDNREVKNGWETLKEKVDGLMTKHGAKILVAKRWDERKLAYEIKKQKRATYYLAYFEADPESIDAMARTLKLSGPVLRHLVLRCEEVPEEAYEPEKEFDLSDEVEEETSEKASDESSDASEGEAKTEESSGEGEASEASEASEATEASEESSESSDKASEGGDADSEETKNEG
jgi:small subunit ribosomal protein S6